LHPKNQRKKRETERERKEKKKTRNSKARPDYRACYMLICTINF